MKYIDKKESDVGRDMPSADTNFVILACTLNQQPGSSPKENVKRRWTTGLWKVRDKNLQEHMQGAGEVKRL